MTGKRRRNKVDRYIDMYSLPNPQPNTTNKTRPSFIFGCYDPTYYPSTGVVTEFAHSVIGFKKSAAHSKMREAKQGGLVYC